MKKETTAINTKQTQTKKQTINNQKHARFILMMMMMMVMVMMNI